MEKMIKLLESSEADAWELTDLKTRGWEFYFIGHRLDQNRAKDVEHIRVKIYKYSEDRQSLGMATAEVSPSESEDMIRKTISDLVYQASLVKNKPYRLNPPVAAEEPRGSLTSQDVSERQTGLSPLAEDAKDYITIFQNIAETDTEYLNSYEIFTERNEQRLITSEGIDITQIYPTSMLDIVVNARNDEHEIELYRLYHLGSCSSSQVRQDIEELLRFGKDRLKAVPTPHLGLSAIVLSTDAAVSVYEYFLDNLNAAFLVRGMSQFEIGKPIASQICGDRVTLQSVRFLEGSPSNFSYDSEGAPIRDCVLMESFIPEKFIGSRMFSQYLGLEESFIVSNWSVGGGSKNSEEIRTGQFLEIVEFSDFQVDSMTGDLFGEIRLAYYHDENGQIIPVTGGSVSGNMMDNIGHMYMTRKTRCYANAQIPCATRLEKITIAGAASNV